MRKGFSLIDLVLAIGIITVLFGGIFLVYFSIVDTAANYELRRGAANILNQKVELTRSLSYEEVGVVGGIPSGVLAQNEQIEWDGRTFVVSAAVRNIDDPFDGTATSTPLDTAPADYKLVEFTVSCPTCARFTPVAITTTVAPRGLESASQNGSLFITVFDADGMPIQGASVTIQNTSTNPTINFTDITDTNGRLQLVDVPTSTQAYSVTVTKNDFSTEQTYPLGAPANPNPVKPHATVSSQTVTELSFTIDELGSIPVASTGYRCEAVGNEPFSITSSKLIGTSPDVVKRTFAGSTDGNGQSTVPTVEWDTYAVVYEGGENLAGTIPLLPLTVAPGADQALRFVLQQVRNPALLVTVRDAATGNPVTGLVTLDGPGNDIAAYTSEATYEITDWAAEDYVAATGIDPSGGTLSLAPAGGPYATSTPGILESATIDLGGTPAGLKYVDWDAITSGAGPNAVRIQVAASDTNANWNFVGPDGTGDSYFTTGGTLPEEASNKRYVRYRVYLQTSDSAVTPEIQTVRLNFSGPCVPPGQRLFDELAQGSYEVRVQAGGYTDGTANTTVGSGWDAVEIILTPS